VGGIVALYTGDTISSARLVFASADPSLVAYVAETLLHHDPDFTADETNPAAELEAGRRRALRLVRDQALTELQDESETEP
jgi:hypothetical protein